MSKSSNLTYSQKIEELKKYGYKVIDDELIFSLRSKAKYDYRYNNILSYINHRKIKNKDDVLIFIFDNACSTYSREFINKRSIEEIMEKTYNLIFID